jgi:hypothetical protein
MINRLPDIIFELKSTTATGATKDRLGECAVSMGSIVSKAIRKPSPGQRRNISFIVQVLAIPPVFKRSCLFPVLKKLLAWRRGGELAR